MVPNYTEEELQKFNRKTRWDEQARHEAGGRAMKLKHIKIILCEACLNGSGGECHTPGCAMFLHDAPDLPILPELYDVIEEWENVP